MVLNPDRHPNYEIRIICTLSLFLIFRVTTFCSFSWHDIWYSCLTSFSEWSPKCYLKSAAIMDTIKKNREANFGPSPWSRTPRTWDAPTTKLQLHLHRIIHHRATELHPIWTHSIRQNRGCQRQVGKLFGTTVTFFMFGTNSVQWRNTSTARAVPNNRFLPWRNTWEMFVNDFILFRKCKWWIMMMPFRFIQTTNFYSDRCFRCFFVNGVQVRVHPKRSSIFHHFIVLINQLI